MDQSELDALYQEYLGRPADPSGIATWSSQDPNAVVAGILGSPEYQASHPSGGGDGGGGGGGGGGGAPSVDNMQPVTDPSSGDTQYQYQDSSGGTVTVDSSGNPVSYTPGASWYQQQYAAHPDAIRSGYRNQQYLATGPLDQTYTVNGKQVPITNAYEYQVDPNTKALTNTPVYREQSSGGLGDWMAENGWMLPLMVAGGAAGAEFLPGLLGEAAAPLGTTFEGLTPAQQLLYSGTVADSTALTPGASAILNGTAATLPSTAAATGAGLGTIGSGYAGIGLNPAIQTGGNLAYSGLGLNPAITGSTGIGLNAAIPSITSGLATNAGALAAASGVPIDAATFAGAGALTAEQAAALDAALTSAASASTLPFLSSLAPLLGPLAKLAGGAGSGSSALNGLTGGTKPTNVLFGSTPGSTSINENYTFPQGTLVHGQQVALPEASQYNVPVTNLPQQVNNPQSLQEIQQAADGGIMHPIHLSGGGEPELPEGFFKPWKPIQSRGQQIQGHPNLTNMGGIPLSHPKNMNAGGNLSMQDRTLPEGHNPQFFSEGGLNSIKHRYVTGAGDGTSDSIPAMLANGEFVIPADVVSSLGNGSNDSGAHVLDNFLKTIRAHKQKHDSKHLPPDSKGPLAYLLEAKRKVRS
jgi:hypothetical protein